MGYEYQCCYPRGDLVELVFSRLTTQFQKKNGWIKCTSPRLAACRRHNAPEPILCLYMNAVQNPQLWHSFVDTTRGTVPTSPWTRPTSCRSYEYTCHNGYCVYQWDVCDGSNDCGDNSDEWFCGMFFLFYCFFVCLFVFFFKEVINLYYRVLLRAVCILSYNHCTDHVFPFPTNWR